MTTNSKNIVTYKVLKETLKNLKNRLLQIKSNHENKQKVQIQKQ